MPSSPRRRLLYAWGYSPLLLRDGAESCRKLTGALAWSADYEASKDGRRRSRLGRRFEEKKAYSGQRVVASLGAAEGDVRRYGDSREVTVPFLIDHARSLLRQKRGGDCKKVS